MRSGLLVSIAIGLVWQTPRIANAEINTADSLEWAVADADLIVRGTVTATSTIKRSGKRWHLATITVSESLKGSKPATLDLVMASFHGDDPAKWYGDNAEVLLFLVDSKRHAKKDEAYKSAPFALRDSPWLSGAAVRLTGPRVGKVYTAGFDVLTTRNDILKATRNAVSFGSKARASHHVEAEGPAARDLWSGSSVWFYLPVDRSLERRAHTWLLAKDIWRREQGVRALAHFRSAKNIVVLKIMLLDAGYATQTTTKGRRFRLYTVRRAAYDVLTKWGTTVKRPTVRESLPYWRLRRRNRSVVPSAGKRPR